MNSDNLSELVRNSIGEQRLHLLDLVVEEAGRQALPLYLVGGAVRDLVLGRPVRDMDLTVEGDAIRLARALAGRHGGGVTAYTRFGTATWFLPDDLKHGQATLDLVSARSETYRHPGALPTVGMGSLEDDLRRRDFTINAIAVRLDGDHSGEVRDPFSGRDDLQKGLVRVLHAPSFTDDPTRMYRAVRYAVRYGFRIADDTLALIADARPGVQELSAQRIRHELDLILDEPAAAAILQQLDGLGLLEVIHPALGGFERSHLADSKSDDPALKNRTSRWLLWLMHLGDQDIEFINNRLHFRADLLKLLRSAAVLETNLPALHGLQPSKVVELLEGYPIKALEVFSSAVEEEEERTVLNRYLAEWWGVKPRTTGHDLKSLGIPPGPKYNEILRRLRAAWLDGEVKTEEEEKRLLDTIL